MRWNARLLLDMLTVWRWEDTPQPAHELLTTLQAADPKQRFKKLKAFLTQQVNDIPVDPEEQELRALALATPRRQQPGTNFRVAESLRCHVVTFACVQTSQVEPSPRCLQGVGLLE